MNIMNNLNNNKNLNQVSFGINASKQKAAQEAKEAEQFRQMLADEFDDTLELVRSLMGEEDKQNEVTQTKKTERPKSETSKTTQKRPVKNVQPTPQYDVPASAVPESRVYKPEPRVDARHVVVNKEGSKPISAHAPQSVKTEAKTKEELSKDLYIAKHICEAFNNRMKTLDTVPLEEKGVISSAQASWIKFSSDYPASNNEMKKIELDFAKKGYIYELGALMRLYSTLSFNYDKDHKPKENDRYEDGTPKDWYNFPTAYLMF